MDINKFLMNTDDVNNNIINEHIIRTEGNKKASPKVNKKRSKSNSKSYNNKMSTPSQKNKSTNITNNSYNQKILEIIRNTEEQLGSLDSKKHIKYAVKLLESFQAELIGQLEQEYDENSIKKILQSNFDKIIRLLIEYFTLYDNNCANCISNLKIMLKNIINTNIKSYSDSDSNLNVEENYSNNIPIIDEEKKKEFLNEEEIIVGLINSLSGGIKTCNKNYRTTILDMAKLIEESNNALVDLKQKLDKLNNQLKTKYMQDIQFKKNTKIYMDNIVNEVENLYSMNINVIEGVKILDTNQTSFYEEAKEIFNHLKTNHSKKLKEFHILFKSISYIQSNTNSNQQIIKKRGKSISGNERKKFGEEEKDRDKNDELNNWENKMNRNNSTKDFNIKNTYEKLDNISGNLNENINNLNIFTLSEQVLEFFNKMKNLQESIVKKISGINQMKIDFERYKKKLIKLLNTIISNKKKGNNINQSNSKTKLNSNDNDTIILNNKNNINLNNNQSNKTLSIANNKIMKAEDFQIINVVKINKKLIENKEEENSNELQIKYNNSLEDINNKSQEINKLQDKINKLLLENNELKTKNKKYEKDNQVLSSKMNNINSSDKKNKVNNINDFDKVNIDDIISSSNNINNNSINSNQDLFKLTDYEVKLKQENQNLKNLMNKCVHIIFESIKETSPNMIEDIINEESEEKTKNNTNNNQDEKENEEEFDFEYITEAVKKFQSYNNDMANNLKKAEKDKEKYEKEAHDNLVKAEAYKNALDQAINKINLGEEGNNSDIGDKNHNKRQFTFDGEGEISFKENIGSSINNNVLYKNNKKNENEIENQKDKNNDNNINEEINKLIINSNIEENNNNINDNNKSNEDPNKVNKDLLKVQQNLIEKIKFLEEEIEKNKTNIHNLFIESGNDIYDSNEMTVSLVKYNRLLKLLETEQERNKNLEEKYITFINEITEGLSLSNILKNNNNNNLSSKLKTNMKGNENNKIDDENIEFEDHLNRNNKKINKNRTYGELNVHNENYLSLLNKDININGDEEENDDDENDDDIRKNGANSGLYKNLRIQELIDENKDLKEKENLLSTQLITIKQELKETRYFLDEMKNKNIELAQEIESQGTLRNQNLIGSLRNCLERLITEMKITNKIKEILIVILRLASYTDEQIEIIFKYKEKKKNIINIFQI